MSTIRKTAAFAIAVAFVIALTALLTGQPAAQAATCRTTHTYTRTVTSTGTATQRWTLRYACGRAYEKWEHIAEQSYTGSHYTEDLYRNELTYPHYWQKTVKDAWSAKGVFKYTVTITTG